MHFMEKAAQRVSLKAWRFRNEDAARKHVEKVRWGGKPVCPRCLSGKVRQMFNSTGVGDLWCKKCKRKSNVRMGTDLEGSHVPLSKWLIAIRLIAANGTKVGIPQIRRQLKLGSYHTAAKLLQALKDEALDSSEDPGLITLLILHDRKMHLSPSRRVALDDFDEDATRVETTRRRRGTATGYSLSELSEKLKLPLNLVIALSRVPQMEKHCLCVRDEILLRRDAPLPAIRILLGSDPDLVLQKWVSRSVERPLPPAVWRSLREAYDQFNASPHRFAVYRYLHCVYSTLHRRYHGEKAARLRLTRKGLQMAFMESSENLKADRCNRYAHAIRLVGDSRSYDGSVESFEDVLRAKGGLDRAVRARASRGTAAACRPAKRARRSS